LVLLRRLQALSFSKIAKQCQLQLLLKPQKKLPKDFTKHPQNRLIEFPIKKYKTAKKIAKTVSHSKKNKLPVILGCLKKLLRNESLNYYS
jgi:hypothetical protein